MPVDLTAKRRAAARAIAALRAAVAAIADGHAVRLVPEDMCTVLHEAEAAEGLRAALRHIADRPYEKAAREYARAALHRAP